ncbi:MAG: NnrS family protein [Proteobacteria bacterium]|nr:NnrS family protein [Pseudomonadota bacterium]
MSLIQISKRIEEKKTFALFEIGFRIFFLGAAIFSALTMSLWLAIYSSHISLATSSFSSFQWHAHEMIYGYAMAVIAGFLLTAIPNWTGVRTIYGSKLATLFFTWFLARICFIFGSELLIPAALFDSLFNIFLIVSTLLPIHKAKKYKQLLLLSKIFILTLGNICFYLGSFGIINDGVSIAIYGGLYTIISIILTIGSRVVPMFIENGVGYNVNIRNPKTLTILSFIIFPIFVLNDLFMKNEEILRISGFALALIISIKLYFWHTVGIWRKPLLWSLFLAYCFIAISFLLIALSPIFGFPKSLAIHLLAVGGIGFSTLAMMTRVSLGHTGRNVNNPPRATNYYLTTLLFALFFRVLLPLIDFSRYQYYIAISQALWIITFVIFTATFAKVFLIKSKTSN